MPGSLTFVGCARWIALALLVIPCGWLACNRDPVPVPVRRPPDLALPDLTLPDLALPQVPQCPALAPLCAWDVRNGNCRMRDADCTVLVNPFPLHCTCGASSQQWLCQDCRCANRQRCADSDLTCSYGDFEPELCKCVLPEGEWACYSSGTRCAIPQASDGRPCYIWNNLGNLCDPPGMTCVCEHDHWRCQNTDGG